MMSKADIENFIPTEGSVCPVSGLPVFSEPGWHASDPHSAYRARFYRVGDKILVRNTSGKATGSDAVTANQLHQTVETSILKTTPNYIQIENFSELVGFNLAARRTYIKHFEKRPHLRGLIFYGVSPFMSVNIRIAAKLYTVKYPVKVVASYNAAIKSALEIISEDDQPGGKNSTENPQSDASLALQEKAQRSFEHPIETLSNPD